MTSPCPTGGLPGFFDLVALDAVGSTNDEATARAAAGAAEGTLVWARRQTGGRGRRGRGWLSPAGNLFTSTVLRPACGLGEAPQLSFVAALAVRDTVAGFLGAPPTGCLKWPNDVLIDGCKIAGILLESLPGPGAVPTVGAVVLGVGINVGRHPAVVADGRPATSLAALAAAAGAAAPSVETVRDRYGTCLLAWYRRWQAEGFAPVRAAWWADAFGLDRPVTVRLPDRAVRGMVVDLDPSGALIVARADGGGRLAVSGGDVAFDAAAPTGHDHPEG